MGDAERATGLRVDDDWDRLQRLYHGAMELAPSLRADYVQQTCAGASGTRDRLLKMLAVSPSDTVLRVSADVLGRADAPGYSRGQRIGPYRIERELGAGGMGVAYLAYRDDAQFEKRVALKVMRGGVGAAHLAARFRAERQILASLEHPNIARLLDGGETESGAPYIAMEFVDGVPLTQFCVEHELPLRQRLDLVLQVCDAVRHAHANLVVHRDIKPGNVLVTADGTPKLLDFGIAKVLQPEYAAMLAVETQAGMVPFTPGYASPELIRGRSVSTAADVYSLGVVLYELLTGSRPFAGTTVADLVIAFEQGEADAPSRHALGVDRDLDAIVAMAIRLEPAARYGSVEALARDLRRYLAGFPVEARRGRWAYRARKLLVRHRVSASLAAAGVVAVVALSAGLAIFARRAAEERDTAQAAAEFLAEVFQAPDPTSNAGREPTASEILARGASRIERDLADRPAVQGMLLEMIGRTYRDMGQTDQARSLLEKALAVHAAEFGPDARQTGQTLQNLGRLLQQTGEHVEAERRLRDALRILTRQLGDDSFDVARTKNMLGLTLWETDRIAEASDLLESAVATLERAVGRRHPVWASAMGNLAWVKFDQGDLAESERRFRTLYTLAKESLPDGHFGVVVAGGNLASVLVLRERATEAEPLARASLAASRALYPQGHPNLATALETLAETLNAVGKLDEAMTLWPEVLEMRSRVSGPTHYMVADDQVQYGDCLRRLGRMDEAGVWVAKGVALQRQLSPTGARLGWLLQFQGRWFEDAGRLDDAEGTYREAGDLLDRAHGAENPFFPAEARVNLGRFLLRAGRAADGRALVQQALAAREARLPADDPLVETARRALQ